MTVFCLAETQRLGEGESMSFAPSACLIFSARPIEAVPYGFKNVVCLFFIYSTPCGRTAPSHSKKSYKIFK